MQNTILKYIFILILGIILFYVYIFNFTELTYRVIKDRTIGENFYSIYYEFLLGLLVFSILLSIIILIKNKKYLLIWIIKGGIITLFLMTFYDANYGGDPTYYADEALKKTFLVPFGVNGTFNIIYINHLFTYLVGNSFYSLKIINSFIGFIGLILLYKTYEYIIKKSKINLQNNFIYFFFLFPTVLFWSSILGKDPLNLFFIGVFSYGFIHLIDSFKIKYLLMIIISIWFVSYIRSWWSIIMVTSIFLYYLKINSVRNFILFLIIMPVFTLLAMQFLQTQGISSIDQIFLKMSDTSSKLAYGGSSVGVHAIRGFGDYVLWFFPNLFTTLFRPMPWDIRNAFTLIAAIENIILFYLVYKYIFKNWRLIYANKYLKFYILLIFSWSLLYVIISPTNLGMAVRFKLQVLPLMLILIGVSKLLIIKRKKGYK